MKSLCKSINTGRADISGRVDISGRAGISKHAALDIAAGYHSYVLKIKNHHKKVCS